MELPYMLKELLYYTILYDYSTKEDENDVHSIDLDEASLEQIDKVLGDYKNE